MHHKYLHKRLGDSDSRLTLSKSIFSPDGQVELRVGLRRGAPFYSVRYRDSKVIRASKLGFVLRNSINLDSNWTLEDETTLSFDETWEQVWGEQRLVRNNYNELAWRLREFSHPKRTMTIRFRIFDEGVGFRYEIPYQKSIDSLMIEDELTEFNINGNASAWWIPAFKPDRYEYLYRNTSISAMSQPVHTPVTFELNRDTFLSIHEAALYNYGSMTIEPVNNNLKANITPLSDGTKAHIATPFVSPWRTISVAPSAVKLTANTMMYNLNEPNKLEDTSWIKPLKFLGIWWTMFVGESTWKSGPKHGATTENAKRYIDYCVRLGIPGLLIEGWNKGWDGDWTKNGDILSTTEPYDDFDIDEVASHAKQKGVEIIGHHETAGNVAHYESQWPTSHEFLKKYDIKYLKTGYVSALMNHREYHHSQFGVLHYQKALELAVKYNIMLNVHEPIKGTGIERTYPNFMTREGARGQEYDGEDSITAEHTTVIPYTRMLAGSFDFTPGAFDLENTTKPVTSTLAKQLAYYVTIFSPMAMVADRPNMLINNRAFDFIQAVPTTWERTVPLAGEIGKYFATARQEREGRDWFIGAVTNENARDISVNLSFLEEGVTYEAKVYQDAIETHYRKNPLEIDISTINVTSHDTIYLHMGAGGGAAVHLTAIS